MNLIAGQAGRGRSRFVPVIYFAVLLAGLLTLYLPSFDNPPRSDYWSAFYVFNRVEISPAPPDWPSILTFDLWQHGTYRPLSHFILYLEYLLFAPNFVWNHILNFAAYFLALLLLYRLAVGLSLDRVLAAAFLGIFTFLFSHSDILTWTFQIFTILALCAFLLGFLLYISFLRDRRPTILIPIGLLFLFGMFCNEAYALWPLAVLLLPPVLRTPNRKKRSTGGRDAWLMLAGVYVIYLAGFVIHRSAAANTGPVPSLTAGTLLEALPAVFFSFFYNGIAVNVLPFLSTPLYYSDNINLGGALWKLAADLDVIVPWLGLAGMMILGAVYYLLRREGKKRTISILAFLFFLYFTHLFTIAAARLDTDTVFYPLSQFRYQYVPNALIALMAAALIGGAFRPGRRGKLIICLLILPVLFFNIILSRRQVSDLGERLFPLRTILTEVGRGLETGTISERERIYIDEEIVRKLPAPSWNPNMARFMEGSLQWLYPVSETGKFALRREEAAWIIRGEDGRVARKDGKQ